MPTRAQRSSPDSTEATYNELCSSCGPDPLIEVVMKRGMLVAALVVLASPLALLSAGGKGAVSGEYVEARTAEVFTGGCIMGSEAETVGKNAVLAWKVDRGSFNGVALDGLTVVAAIAGDRNLGIDEIGGAKAATRSALFVDNRANAAQQMAL